MRKTWLAILIGLAMALVTLTGCASTPSTGPTDAVGSPTAAAPIVTAAVTSATLPAASESGFPLALTDDVGRQVVIEQQPQRIVSLAPSNTEVLFALGLGSNVVGVTDFCDYPAEAKEKPKMGGIKASVEKIVAAEPDLVLAIAETAGPPEVAIRLQDLNVDVVVLGPKDVDGVLSSIQLIGRATGKDTEATALVTEIRAKIDRVLSETQAAAAKPRVMYELDATDPAKPYVPGPGSFIDALLTMAGGQNIAADAKLEWAQLSLEEVVNKDPEIIILGDANYGITPDSVKERPGWSTLLAVKNGKVVPIDDNLVSRPGPRIGDGLEALAKIVHPELFP